MHTKLILTVLITLALALSARAGWQGQATAAYAVKATMDSFVGQAASEPIVVADGAPEVAVTFEIAKMETGKKKRDVEMQHMFHMERHPVIVGTARAEDLLKIGETGEIPVTLAISGQTREVPARISKVTREEGKLTFTADLEISLKSFGLKPPSILKIINVSDLVKVTANFELVQAAQP